jgi:low affinity Fe/Cu permease
MASAMYDRFRRVSHRISQSVGTPWAFGLSLLVVIVWGISGPLFHYSDSWQLTINTGTTIITFLMVFVIQNTQNRESQVVQLKLDELIRSVLAARNDLVDMEDLSDEQLQSLQHEFETLRKKAEVMRGGAAASP